MSPIHFVNQLCEIADGLHYLHEQDIAHGDLRGVRIFL